MPEAVNRNPVAPGAPDTDAAGTAYLDAAGSFWRAVYRDPDLIASLMRAYGRMDASLSRRASETAAAPAWSAAPSLRREVFKPLTINRADRGLVPGLSFRFGDGSVFGAAPAMGGRHIDRATWRYPVTESVIQAEAVRELPAGDALDATVGAGEVQFQSDPFAGRSVLDNEVTVWLEDALLDYDGLHRFSGVLAGGTPGDGIDYTDVLATLVAGSSPATLTALLGSVAGLACTPRRDRWIRSSRMEGLVSGLYFGADYSTVRGTPARFDVYGDPDDVELFWGRVDAAAAELLNGSTLDLICAVCGDSVRESYGLCPSDFADGFFGAPREYVIAGSVAKPELVPWLRELSPLDRPYEIMSEYASDTVAVAVSAGSASYAMHAVCDAGNVRVTGLPALVHSAPVLTGGI